MRIKESSVAKGTTVTAISIPTSSRIRRESILPYALWTAQGLLAAIFLFAGVGKFLMSSEDLTKDIDLSVTFLRFIGVCEVLGAFGMILPGVARIHRALTPIAACGLVIIMLGATVITCALGPAAPAVIPFTVGLLAASVAWGRRHALAG